MSKKPSPPAQPNVIRKLEEMLEYRLPQSRKPLGSIVLSRADAEELLREIYELRQKAEKFA